MGRRSAVSLGRRWHQRLDSVSGGLLLFLVVFAPWGVAGTLIWTSRVITGVGLVLGILLVAKWGVERFTGHSPGRWGSPGRWRHGSVMALGILGGLLLLQVAISVWNARAIATWTHAGLEFDYRDIIPWLPTTYDRDSTAWAGIRYLGFASAFWAAWDWLRGKSRHERHREEDGRAAKDVGRVPDRLRWFLWTVAIHSAVMALVGILHRLDGSRDLLWMVERAQFKSNMLFGPFPYRANAAQYLNLVWPVTVGFWWALRNEHHRMGGLKVRTGGSPHPMLLLCVALMITGVFVAGSRGGIGVTLIELVLVLMVMAGSSKGWKPRLGLALAFVAALGLGWGLAGDNLKKRFENSLTDETLSGRTATYQTARVMAADFPVWGSGAETYTTLNGLYRPNLKARWEGYVHDDWLETRITMGWVGLGLIVLMLFLIPLAGIRTGSVPVIHEMRWLLALGLCGMLGHARIDFPFQIPALHLSFLLGSALFMVMGAPLPGKPGPDPVPPDPAPPIPSAR
jgi:hypothetical protein